jgi:hypothetical protein
MFLSRPMGEDSRRGSHLKAMPGAAALIQLRA